MTATPPLPPPPTTTTTTAPSHITSIEEPFPSPAHLAQATATHRQGGFSIASRKLPISKAGPIAALESALGIPVPEMIFGDNLLAVRHEPTGFAVAFGARDALDAVDKTGTGAGGMLQVAHARSWSASRERAGDAGIMEVVRPFDWSYSTAYRGTVHPGRRRCRRRRRPAHHTSPTNTNTSTDTSTSTNTEGISPPPPPPPPPPPQQQPEENEEEGEGGEEEEEALLDFAPTTRKIPLELLRRRDPILFFDEVVLYESELDDNGVSVLSAKVRVHERRMLLLCRLFMRVDGVVVRVRDTRVYVDFAAEEVLREYTAREGAFEDTKRALLMTGLRPDEITIALRDANRVADLLPIVEQTLEGVSLKS